MNEMQHQQNHIWFKGKNLKIKHINAIGQEAISLHRDIIIIGRCVISVTSL